MKVCQVLAGNEEGGLEKHTVELAERLQKKGMDVTVVAHEKFAQELEGVRFVPMDLSKSRRNPLTLWRLGKFLRRERFDIVHTQANKATDMVAVLRPFFSSPTVATLHSQKRHLRGFEKADCVITVSKKIGETLRNVCKTTIYNGLTFPYTLESLQCDLHRTYRILKNRFIVCTVARLTRVKRIDIMIEALAKLDDVHLIVVGDGEEKKRWEALAKRKGVEKRITFTGALYGKAVYEIVHNADVFLMTSDNEGFPYTFVESMFCRTPFISTPVSDISDFIGERYTVPFGDAEAVAQKISEMKASYETVCRDFESLFDRATRIFTLDNMTEETIKVYRKVQDVYRSRER